VIGARKRDLTSAERSVLINGFECGDSLQEGDVEVSKAGCGHRGNDTLLTEWAILIHRRYVLTTGS